MKKRLIKQVEKVDWKLFLVCMFISYFVAYMGSSFTVIDDWYESIKPSITPPNFVFPIVWSILFFLIGLSLYFSWSSFEKNKKEEREKMGLLYSLNFAFILVGVFSFLQPIVLFLHYLPLYY